MSNFRRVNIVLWPILYALMLWFDLAPAGAWLFVLPTWLYMLYGHGREVAKERDAYFENWEKEEMEALKREANNE